MMRLNTDMHILLLDHMDVFSVMSFCEVSKEMHTSLHDEKRKRVEQHQELIKSSRSRVLAAQHTFRESIQYDYVDMECTVTWKALQQICCKRIANCEIHHFDTIESEPSIVFFDRFDRVKLVANFWDNSITLNSSGGRERAVFAVHVWILCDLIHSVGGVITSIECYDLMNRYIRWSS